MYGQRKDERGRRVSAFVDGLSVVSVVGTEVIETVELVGCGFPSNDWTDEQFSRCFL